MDSETITPNQSSHDFPESSRVIRYLLIWLRGFHRDREKSKAADWAMVILTFLTLVAAVVSAWLFQAQLKEARRSTDAAIHNFRLDERAWIELEPVRITATVSTSDPSKGMRFEGFLKNVGKTVATNVEAKIVTATGLDGRTGLGGKDEAKNIANTQKTISENYNKYWDEQTKSAIPKVIAPNSVVSVPVSVPFTEVDLKAHYPFYLVGRIDYVDEFKVSHWLNFCYIAFPYRVELRSCLTGNNEDENPEPI